MIFKLYRLLTWIHPREYLPRLPTQLINPYHPRELTDDEQLILLAGKARDPEQARQLMRDAGVTSALGLDLSRPRPKANIRERLLNWLRRLEGSTPTEQVISRYLKDQKHQTETGQRGVHERRLDRRQ